MKEMTAYERTKRMFEHKEADRIPIIDSPWGGTVRNWRKQGMLRRDWRDCFGVDKWEGVSGNYSPRFEYKTIEDTPDYYIATNEWGVTAKQFKKMDSTPEFLDFKINKDSWYDIKKRMQFDTGRINLNNVRRNIAGWRKDGRWIQAIFWFGFDVSHSWMVGTESVLLDLALDPDWLYDLFKTCLEGNIAVHQYLYDNGCRLDAVHWPDDMGYRDTQFFSEKTYCEMLKPLQKQACDWAHSHGMYTHLHSCGNIMPFVPHLAEIGIDLLSPLEVKAGMKPAELKQKFGGRMSFMGGINAAHMHELDYVIAEMEALIPKMKEGGGYIFASDHSIPNVVTKKIYKTIVAKAKELGRF